MSIPIPAAPATPPRRRFDRLTVLNWLAFLAILGMTLGEGCAMQAAKRRQAREARELREACDPAVAGVGLAFGAPPATPPDPDAPGPDAPAGCARAGASAAASPVHQAAPAAGPKRAL